MILVAHSLACCLVAHWSAAHTGPVQGALLVAPSDVEADTYPPGTTGFAPMPLNRLPFPSIVLASTDDPYVSVERARQFAEAWGARFEVVGALGHINSASELGGWGAGLLFCGGCVLAPGLGAVPEGAKNLLAALRVEAFGNHHAGV